MVFIRSIKEWLASTTAHHSALILKGIYSESEVSECLDRGSS